MRGVRSRAPVALAVLALGAPAACSSDTTVGRDAAVARDAGRDATSGRGGAGGTASAGGDAARAPYDWGTDGARRAEAGPRAPRDAAVLLDVSAPGLVDAQDSGSVSDAFAPRTLDAGREAGSDASGGGSLPGFGPGFTELILPIEGTVPLVVPAPDSRGGGVATLAIVRDLDGDGAPEVVLSAPQGPQDLHTILGYDTASRSLSVKGSLGPIDLLTIADLDDDGNVDLLSRLPFGVAWGQGGGAFGPVLGNYAAASPRNAVLDDVDRDGWLDIVADDPDTGSPRDFSILLRTGPRTFADHSDMLPTAPHTCPFSLLAGELHVGEKLLMVFGSPCQSLLSHASGVYRETGVDAAGYPTFASFDPLPPGLPFARIGGDAGLTSRAPMGAAFGDLDDDGFSDLSIAFDPVLSAFGGVSGFPLTNLTYSTGFAEVPGAVPGSVALPWGTAFVDLDQDGRKDVVAAHGNDPGAWLGQRSRIGAQTATVHWNVDGAHFIDATAALGVGRPGQWKALSVGDLDRDGDADLLVGGQSELPRVYRNDIASGNHGFALAFHGTSSNAPGVGARVDVTVASGATVQHYVNGGIGSPFAVAEPLVFVGLGRASSADRVMITWPSGVIQELDGLTAGAVHTAVEPALFTVSPEARHQPADGASEIVVTVAPRDLRGNVAQGATVTVAATGTGTVTGPTAKGDGTFDVHVVAPAAPGSIVLQIVVNGVPAGVRPRLFWD